MAAVYETPTAATPQPLPVPHSPIPDEEERLFQNPLYEQPDPRVYKQPDPRVYEQPDPRVYKQPDPRVYKQPDPQVYEQPDPQVYEVPTSNLEVTMNITSRGFENIYDSVGNSLPPPQRTNHLPPFIKREGISPPPPPLVVIPADSVAAAEASAYEVPTTKRNI